MVGTLRVDVMLDVSVTRVVDNLTLVVVVFSVDLEVVVVLKVDFEVEVVLYVVVVGIEVVLTVVSVSVVLSVFVVS